MSNSLLSTNMWQIGAWPYKKQKNCTNNLMRWNPMPSSILKLKGRPSKPLTLIPKRWPQLSIQPNSKPAQWSLQNPLLPTCKLLWWLIDLAKMRDSLCPSKPYWQRAPCSIVQVHASTTAKSRLSVERTRALALMKAHRSNHSKIRCSHQQSSSKPQVSSRIRRRGWMTWRDTEVTRNMRIRRDPANTNLSNRSCARLSIRLCRWGILFD